MSKASVTARLKEIEGDAESKHEAATLRDWLTANGEQADLKKQRKEAEAALDAAAYAKYPKLGESDVKTLVDDDKWLGALEAAVAGEMDRVSQGLTRRVKELSERYETPLPAMSLRVEELEARGNGHLEKMGVQPLTEAGQACTLRAMLLKESLLCFNSLAPYSTFTRRP